MNSAQERYHLPVSGEPPTPKRRERRAPSFDTDLGEMQSLQVNVPSLQRIAPICLQSICPVSFYNSRPKLEIDIEIVAVECNLSLARTKGERSSSRGHVIGLLLARHDILK